MSAYGNLEPSIAKPLLLMRQDLQRTGIALALNRKQAVDDLARLDEMLNQTTKAVEAVSQLLNVFDVPMEDFIPF